MAKSSAAVGPDSLRGRRRVGEGVIKGLLLACALASLVTTIGILFTLVGETLAFFRESSLWAFLTGTRWAAGFSEPSYGVLPLLKGTFYVTGIGMLVAIPLGLAIAVYLSEYAPRRVRTVLKPALELLAGIPTVVLGFFALYFVTPMLQSIIPGLEIFNVLAGGIVVGVMITPTIASLSEDAMRAVPQGLREAAFGLGAGRRRVALRVVMPAALSGIVSSIILGFARAIGETMIVAIAVGNCATMSFDPRVCNATMTGAIVGLATGDTPAGSIEFRALFALGSTLFAITYVLNYLSHRVVRRFREAYE